MGTGVMSVNTVRCVIIYSPLRPEKRTIFDAPHTPGQTIVEYVQHIDMPDGCRMVAARNGRTVDPHAVCPQPGDIVSVSLEMQPGAIASAVASQVAAAVAVASTTYVTTLVTVYAATYALVYAATTFAIGWGMSQLASALGGGPEKPDLGSIGGDAATSPTYGWGPLRQTETEGNPIPILFGTHKLSGQVINKFKTVGDDSKEYFNALLAVNDGAVDSIDNIRVNDQPVAYYRSVETFTRSGGLQDDPIDGFAQIVQQRSLGIRLSTTETIQETDGNQVNRLKLILQAPSGLYHTNDEGGLDERHVDIDIAYRVKGTSTWAQLDTYRLTGKTTSAIRKSVDIKDLTPGQYEIRIKRLTSESISFKESTKVYLTAIKEIVDEELIYPGIAKYAIKALATDQLSGSEPALSCIATRNTVPVYNPYTSQWESRPASNPAWMAYCLLNTYAHIHHTRILYDEFQAWADYCDEYVDGAPRFQAGIYFDSASNAWECVQRVADLARARVLRRGSKYGVFVDKPEDMVSHLFTVGNIVEESFGLQYLPQKERANAIEITYVDPDRDYTNQVVGVYSDDYQSSNSTPKKTSVKYNAAVPRQQVIREAAFRLNCNKYLVRIIEFEAATDSFSCTVGDLVYFQHFIPQYEESMGGRVVAAGNDDGSGNPYVQLDQQVTLEAGTAYGILVRLNDDSLVEKSLQPVSTTHETDTLLLQNQWQDVPEQYDLYVCGPATTYLKTYRVTNITRAQDLTRRITLMEYVEAIYNDDNYVIEEPTWGEALVQQATNVSTDEFLTYGKGGDYQSNIAVSWNAANDNTGSNWDVWLRDDTISSQWSEEFDDSFADTDNAPALWHIGRSADMSFTIGPAHLVQDHNYTVIVSPAQEAPTDTGNNTSRVQVRGKLAPPDDIVNFSATWNPIKRTVNFVWSEVDNIDLSHYEIRKGENWDSGEVVVRKTRQSSASLFIAEGTTENQTYWIKTVDTSGIKSINAAQSTVAVDTGETPLATPTGLTLTSESAVGSDGTDHATLIATWDSNAVSDDFGYYRLTLEDMESGAKSRSTTPDEQYQWQLTPNKTYGVSLEAVDKAGVATISTNQKTITTASDANAPAAPQWAVTPLVPGFKVVGLRWLENSEPDLKGYKVERSATGDFAGEQVGLGLKDGSFTTDTDLAVGQTYYYRIRAVDTSGNESGWSTIQSATTLQVGQADLAANSVTANEINVNQLDAIAANLGTIIAGILRADDWSNTGGIYIDVANGVIKAGNDPANPDLSWDGVNLDMTGTMTITGGTGALNLNDGPAESGADVTANNTANDVLTGAGKAVAEVGATNDSAWRAASDTTLIDGGQIYAGSQIQIGNLDGYSDFCEITDGDIDFYYYTGSAHKLYKTLKRIEGGIASDGDTVDIPGYWKSQPNVWTFPASIETYNPDYPNQSQTLDCFPTNIVNYNDGKYRFDLVAASYLKSPSLVNSINESFYQGYTDAGGDRYLSDNFSTQTYTTTDLTTEITFHYEWEARTCDGEGGDWSGHIDVNIYVTIDGSEQLIESYTDNTYDVTRGGSNSKSISVSSGVHDISMRAYMTVWFDECYVEAFNSFTWNSYTTNSDGNVKLKSGTARWIAIGE